MYLAKDYSQKLEKCFFQKRVSDEHVNLILFLNKNLC